MKENYIISSCAISKNIIVKNNKQLFSIDADSIQSFLLSAYHHLKIDYPKFYKMDNLSKLGFLASEVLLVNADINNYERSNVSIALSNSNSSLDTDIKYFDTVKDFASPALFVYTLPNIVLGEIAIRNKLKGENAFFISEKFNAELLCNYVNILFDAGKTDLCICGWVDVLEENYKAVLFLVSTKKRNAVLLFNKENLNNIFRS